MCMILVVASFGVELGCGLMVGVDELGVPIFVLRVFVLRVVVKAVVSIAPVNDTGTGLFWVVADQKRIYHLGGFSGICFAVVQKFHNLVRNWLYPRTVFVDALDTVDADFNVAGLESAVVDNRFEQDTDLVRCYCIQSKEGFLWVHVISWH